SRVDGDEGADRVHLLLRRLVRQKNVDDELLLLVVGPRDEPRAEADEDAEQEHPDEDRDRRGQRRRLVRADRAERLRDEQPKPGHYSAPYPPRRSSRTSLPSSSAMTRFRI